MGNSDVLQPEKDNLYTNCTVRNEAKADPPYPQKKFGRNAILRAALEAGDLYANHIHPILPVISSRVISATLTPCSGYAQNLMYKYS
ncbi:hypothetical protein RRG08_009254 [Elysia crispata]|uniref:Uncharacterized protein n=1 Tax=Elysia crispata TaxID=231223 RepID=A0AAE1AZ18_9GAST|nr:hypothetical protein RRG08_009254 [Elysia crispata]